MTTDICILIGGAMLASLLIFALAESRERSLLEMKILDILQVGEPMTVYELWKALPEKTPIVRLHEVLDFMEERNVVVTWVKPDNNGLRGGNSVRVVERISLY